MPGGGEVMLYSRSKKTITITERRSGGVGWDEAEQKMKPQDWSCWSPDLSSWNLSCSSSGRPSGASAFAQPPAAQCHPPGPSAGVSIQWPLTGGARCFQIVWGSCLWPCDGSPCHPLLFCPASASRFLSHLAHCLPQVPIWPHFLPHIFCLCPPPHPTPQRHVPDPQNSCWFCIFQDREGEKCKGETVLFHVIPGKAVFLKWEEGTSVHLGAFGKTLLW